MGSLGADEPRHKDRNVSGEIDIEIDCSQPLRTSLKPQTEASDPSALVGLWQVMAPTRRRK
jgi:hypothetical protein